MVSSRNVDEVVSFLKKELVKTHDQEYERVKKKNYKTNTIIHKYINNNNKKQYYNDIQISNNI